MRSGYWAKPDGWPNKSWDYEGVLMRSMFLRSVFLGIQIRVVYLFLIIVGYYWLV